MTQMLRHIATTGLTSCLLWAGCSAHAQDNEADALTLEMVTVEGNLLYDMLPSEQTRGYAVDAATVGTKTPAALRDIPQSVTVVTRDAIEDRNLDTLDELARRTPGLRVLTNDAGRSSIYARGYEYDEYNIDGLPAPMASINGTLPNLAAFDRVEVMRGPSGLFNSTSEMGGIVNLVRKRPTDTFQGHITGRYGRWNQHYLEADVGGPITEDGRLRGRAVAADSDTDGFVDHNDNASQTFYGTLEYDIDPDTTVSLAYLRQERDITVNNGLATDADGNLLDIDRSTFFGADWNDFSMDSDDVIGELTHRFENGGYGRVAARYSDRNADYNYAFGGGPLGDDGTVTVAGTAGDIDETAFSADASYSQPFEALGQVSEFVIGSDYKHYDTDSIRARARLPATQLEDFDEIAYVDFLETGALSANNQKLEEIGVYSKLTFRPIERLALIGGARVSDYKVELTDLETGATSERDRNGKLTPYGGLVFDLDAHHSLYASYSEVFKPQTANDENNDLIEPREGTQYEAGIKGSYFAGNLNARVSAFNLTDRNYAAGVPGETYSAAIGKRTIKGAEVEISGSPIEQFDLIAGYTYMDTEVERGDPDATFLLMPDHILNLWAQYGFEGGTLDGFSVGGGVTALSDFSSSQGVEAPGYAVVDAMLGYEFTDQLSGQLNVNNLLDKAYYNRVGSTGTFNFYGAPRSLVASLRYDF
ncbi:TonB-dependent siderophore receptor [Endozoicomonas sp. G2_2]|uniref:TonB-dependent siderophore receptor n=1 Tax=Endozoicomonas sp. G2_2 TaxID=2821092 RepID=UPI001ADC6C45|nr:TonB-dependent siderophore receptor [Endozoicomonas sp. G2_2]MBO9468894.1 TonB-dependent siderophore receptor [Endozoicomonas sp. G2_2]